MSADPRVKWVKHKAAHSLGVDEDLVDEALQDDATADLDQVERTWQAMGALTDD